MTLVFRFYFSFYMGFSCCFLVSYDYKANLMVIITQNNARSL